MKLKHLLLEATSRTKVVSEEEAVQLYRSNCKAHNDRTTPIFRGLRVSDAFTHGYVQPSKHTRKSKNTSNFYTLLMDNSPMWRAYPDRSKSIICTTDYTYATGYGNAFRVIPFDGATIGIAPENDIWGSIDVIKNRYGIYLGKFNRTLTDLSRLMSSYKWELSDESFKEFKKGLIRMGENKEKFFKEIEFSSNYGDLIGKNMQKFAKDYLDFNGNLYEFVESLFDPKKNGFQAKKYSSSFKAPKGNEVWTDSDCLLIDDAFYEDFIKKVNVAS